MLATKSILTAVEQYTMGKARPLEDYMRMVGLNMTTKGERLVVFHSKEIVGYCAHIFVSQRSLTRVGARRGSHLLVLNNTIISTQMVANE